MREGEDTQGMEVCRETETHRGMEICLEPHEPRAEHSEYTQTCISELPQEALVVFAALLEILLKFVGRRLLVVRMRACFYVS